MGGGLGATSLAISNYEGEKMKKLMTLLLLSLTIFIGCSKDDNPTNPNNSSDFIPLPLKLGNLWIYDHTNPNGTSQRTNSVTGNLTINGEPAFQLNDDWLFDNDGCYYKDGLLYGCKVSDPTTTTEVVFPKNPTIGQTWIVDNDTWKLEATNVSVTVPAGTFICYKISVTKTSSSYNTYWSNGKGIIKVGEVTDLDFDLLKTIQLN